MRQVVPISPHARLLAPLLVLMASAGPLVAAPAVVVPDRGDSAGSERARERVQLLAGTALSAERTYGPDDLLEAAAYRPVVEGDIEPFGCTGPALDQGSFDARLGEARRQADELDLEGAAASLVRLERDLPCAEVVLGARPLHDIFFFAGLVAARRGDEDGAVSRFRDATAIEQDVPLPADLPSEAHPLYRLGREASLAAIPGTLTVLPPLDAQRAWLDGRSIAPTGEALAVRPGTHLLHIETWGGALRGVGLTVMGDGLWADPRAAAAAILAGGGEGAAATAAEALLARAAEAWQAETIFVAADRSVYVWGESPRTERAPVPLKAPGDRFGLRLGGGVLVRQADYRPEPFLYAAPALALDVALVWGLEVGASVAVGITSVVDGLASILPTADVGLQWAWPGTRLRPWFGARAALALVAPGEPRGGATAWLGLRLHPPRPHALRVGVSMGFGWVGNIQVQARLTVGFGVGGPEPEQRDGAIVGDPPSRSSWASPARRRSPLTH